MSGLHNYYVGAWQTQQFLGGLRGYAPPDGSRSVLDFRTLPQQSVADHANGVGSGFFSTPDTMTLGSDYTLLGTGHLSEINITVAGRNALAHMSGIQPQGTTILECISYLFTDGADPTGENGPKPLNPGTWLPIGETRIDLSDHSTVFRRSVNVRSGITKHEVALRKMVQDDLQKTYDLDPTGKLWRRVLAALKEKHGQQWDDPQEDWALTANLKRQGKGEGKGKNKGKKNQSRAEEHETTFTESWPNNGTTFSSGQDRPWTFVDGSSLTVSGGKLTNTSNDATHHMIRMDAAASSSDTAMKITYISGAASSLGACKAAVRKDNSATKSWYEAQHYDFSGTGLWSLYKYNSGVPTALQTASPKGISANYRIRVAANGSNQEATLEMADTLSGTDTSISTGTYGCVGHYSGGSSPYQSDDPVFGDIAADTSMVRSPLSIPMALIAQ